MYKWKEMISNLIFVASEIIKIGSFFFYNKIY